MVTMTKNKESTRYFSSKQEEYVAKLINGRTVSNSGAAKFTCGDVISDEFIIECKTKMKPSESFSIKKQWLMNTKEYLLERLTMLFVFLLAKMSLTTLSYLKRNFLNMLNY